jgi:ankyrin repeat protein
MNIEPRDVITDIASFK